MIVNKGSSKEKRQKTEDGSQEQRAESRVQRQKSQQQVTSNPELVTRKNSTVFHKKRSSASSPSTDGGKASRLERKGGQKERLPPVIIDFSSEELAIRACDLLRFFNN